MKQLHSLTCLKSFLSGVCSSEGTSTPRFAENPVHRIEHTTQRFTRTHPRLTAAVSPLSPTRGCLALFPRRLDRDRSRKMQSKAKPRRLSQQQQQRHQQQRWS